MKITDEQVEAALQEWWYGDHEDTWEAKMRAALEAAKVLIPEPEYEYGLEDLSEPEKTVWFPLGLEHAKEVSARYNPPREVRRRTVAGEWEEVEG